MRREPHPNYIRHYNISLCMNGTRVLVAGSSFWKLRISGEWMPYYKLLIEKKNFNSSLPVLSSFIFSSIITRYTPLPIPQVFWCKSSNHWNETTVDPRKEETIFFLFSLRFPDPILLLLLFVFPALSSCVSCSFPLLLLLLLLPMLSCR